MRSRTLLAALILAAFSAGCGSAREAPDVDAVVVRNGTLLDGSGGAVVERAAVVARGERIVAAGAEAEIAIPAGATVIDAGGGWIVPGLIDNHVHLRAAPTLDPWIRSGVTTVVDNGNVLSPDEVRARFRGALACGPIVTAPGGYPAFVARDAPALAYTDAVSFAEWLDEARPDCVKLVVERGFLSDYDDATGWPLLEPRQIAAITAAARARGLLARAHVTQAGELEVALDAGVPVIAHTPIERVPDAILRRALESGAIFVSTVALWHEADPNRTAEANLARYVAMGGRIAFGSDYPNLPGAGLAMREVRALAEGGIPPEAIFAALTRDGAAAAGRADLGVLAPGALADIVVLGADPRASVDAYETVRAVVHRGRVVVPASR